MQTIAGDMHPPLDPAAPLQQDNTHPSSANKASFLYDPETLTTKEAEAPTSTLELVPQVGWAGWALCHPCLPGSSGYITPSAGVPHPCQTLAHRPAEGTEAVNTPAAKRRGRWDPQVPSARCPLPAPGRCPAGAALPQPAAGTVTRPLGSRGLCLLLQRGPEKKTPAEDGGCPPACLSGLEKLLQRRNLGGDRLRDKVGEDSLLSCFVLFARCVWLSRVCLCMSAVSGGSSWRCFQKP